MRLHINNFACLMKHLSFSHWTSIVSLQHDREYTYVFSLYLYFNNIYTNINRLEFNMDIIKLIKLSNDAKIYVYLFCDITLKIIFPYVYLNNFIAQ